MKNRATVAFSGGLDSTYLLYLAAQQYGSIDSFAGCARGLETQDKKEQTARGLILKELVNLYFKDSTKFCNIIHRDCVVDLTCLYNSGLGQVPSWLSLALNNIRHDTTSVLLGYVKGDDALTSSVSIKYAWEHLLAGMLFKYTDPTGTRPTLSFPLEMTSKLYILRHLPENLIKHVTWCESTWHPADCGTCSSCKRMISECAAYAIIEPTHWKTHALKKRFTTMKRLYKSFFDQRQSEIKEKDDECRQSQ